jgi:hypothetical protein
MAKVRYTLNELLLELGLFLRDSHQFVTTQQGAPNEVWIGKLAFGLADRYADSELWVWDLPPDAITSRNPWYIKNSGGDGKLTLTEPIGTTALPPNARVVLQNINGKGKPHVLKEQALKFSLLQQNVMVRAKGLITALDVDPESHWQTIPAGLESVYQVIIRDSTYPLDQNIISATTWGEIDQVNNRIYLPYDLSWGGYTVEISGRASFNWPWTSTPNYTVTVDVDPVRTVKDAAQFLLMGDRDDRSQQMSANLFNEKLRTRRNVPLPDEVFLENPTAA